MISWFPRFYIVYLILQELHATRKELNHEFDFQLKQKIQIICQY